MAALTTQNVAAGGAITAAAAAGGGDTVEGGNNAGGWGPTNFLYAVVGGTATTITIDSVAYGPYTSQTVLIPVTRYHGGRVNVTYSQVTGVTVGAVRIAPAPTGITFGT